ncbi:MAG TPA: GrpB family protein [Chloroflexota bacterium]|nr:GrpB family protein [Chloroflexota bacterium]
MSGQASSWQVKPLATGSSSTLKDKPGGNLEDSQPALSAIQSCLFAITKDDPVKTQACTELFLSPACGQARRRRSNLGRRLRAPRRVPWAPERLGYVFRADNPDRTKRYFREPPGQRRTHIHVRRAGSFGEQVALLFRHLMRVHTDVAAEYADLKIKLAERYSGDRYRVYRREGAVHLERDRSG